MNDEVQENLKRSEVATLEKQANASRRVGASIEKLSERLESIEARFVESSGSSSRVALALNILTGALVLVGVAQVLVAVYVN
ncbi:MAG: hypothetical protein ACI8RU_000893 [Zhongshania aliphaticivorans]|jgi:hypothetical protein|uniref:hypothetical protein n=1 Tax=Zhongshania aliphaticivorans TaxID=1470434 RepID=UPI0039E381D2